MVSSFPDHNDLRDRIRAGDRAAFSLLHRQFLLQLAQFFRNRGISCDNIDDLIQETFIRLWIKRQKMGSSSPSYFLFGIARNVAREHHRTSTRLPQSCDPALLEQIPSTSAPEDDRLDAVRRNLEHLSERQRHVIRLIYFESLTRQEVAQRLNLKSESVRKYEYRALQKLRTWRETANEEPLDSNIGLAVK